MVKKIFFSTSTENAISQHRLKGWFKRNIFFLYRFCLCSIHQNIQTRKNKITKTLILFRFDLFFLLQKKNWAKIWNESIIITTPKRTLYHRTYVYTHIWKVAQSFWVHCSGCVTASKQNKTNKSANFHVMCNQATARKESHCGFLSFSFQFCFALFISSKWLLRW